MPVLLVFLVSALSMRMWSEERRSGTLEFLLTSPVDPSVYVLGKFLAGMGLVAIALLLTVAIPVTVSFIGPLDWGPVIGAYVASLLLAGAYLSIGLLASAHNDNQIISLIVAVAICGVFYLLGSDVLTGLFDTRSAQLLKLLGSGSRFESITRGVLDVRDLYYYVSITGVFLVLNLYVLERLRWSADSRSASRRRWGLLAALAVANLLVGDLWLAPLGVARADITEGHIYSISPATRAYLAQLREPLLIRGYFSAKTHPLLAPLVPQLKDLLKEYQVAGHGKVRVEFVDPLSNPSLEREAVEKFGIQPVPFQTATKYQASVVNSYFDIVVQYGDQFEKLGFRDLIDVKVKSESDLDVELKDPEYAVTSAIRKVLYSYQGSGTLFEQLEHPVVFHGYFSDDQALPTALVNARKTLKGVLETLTRASGGRMTTDFRDPAAGDGALATRLEQRNGFRPMVLDLLNSRPFWFYMVLESGGQTVQVPLPKTLDAAGFRRALDAGLKHFAAGFLKTVAIVTPAENPVSGFGMSATGSRFSQLRGQLRQNVRLIDTDLKTGRVPSDADLLLLVAPKDLNKQQLFAVDQFLMRGGSVILASSSFDVQSQGQLAAHRQKSGLEDWLAHNGLVVQPDMVLDPQNSAFPVPMQRNVSGFVVRETELVNYPYFVDVRGDGLGGRLTAGLHQVTMNWASPITVDDKKNASRRVTRLLESSPQAWSSDSTELQPDFRRYGKLGFPADKPRSRQLLGVEVSGTFESYFKGQPSPLLSSTADTDPSSGKTRAAKPGAENDASAGGAAVPVITRVIDKSPESARIILLGSDSFLTDSAIDLASVVARNQNINAVQLVQNAIDWSLEDRGLLALRGRAHFNRTLRPLDESAQLFWEYLNYGLAGFGLVVVWLFRRRWRLRRQAHYRAVLQGGEGL
jgi:ABC-2 type transport system permease protein